MTISVHCTTFTALNVLSSHLQRRSPTWNLSSGRFAKLRIEVNSILILRDRVMIHLLLLNAPGHCCTLAASMVMRLRSMRTLRARYWDSLLPGLKNNPWRQISSTGWFFPISQLTLLQGIAGKVIWSASPLKLAPAYDLFRYARARSDRACIQVVPALEHPDVLHHSPGTWNCVQIPYEGTRLRRGECHCSSCTEAASWSSLLLILANVSSCPSFGISK